MPLERNALPPRELSACRDGGTVAGMRSRLLHIDTRWSALPVLLAGAFMVVLDFFIVNVALPAIATDLGAGESSLEWVVAGYGLAFAAFLITAGRLGDLFGRRRVYVVGLGAVHAHLARLRAGAEPDRAGDRARRAGRVGGDPDAAGAVDDRASPTGATTTPGR